MARPLVLIPSSKAKAAGGDDPSYQQAVTVDGPLAEPRRVVLAALRTAAAELDDRGVAKLCGVPADGVAVQRRRLAALDAAPTMPAHRRYTGVVHRFADLAAVDPAAARVDVAVFSGLLGVALLHEPVPDYRLEVTGRVPELGVLRTWWRRQLGDPLRRLTASRRVWDLLPGEFAGLWPDAERNGADVTAVRFQREDGRAAPAASAKVAKGHVLRLLLDEPDLTPAELAAAQPLDGWRVERRAGDLVATQVA